MDCLICKSENFVIEYKNIHKIRMAYDEYHFLYKNDWYVLEKNAKLTLFKRRKNIQPGEPIYSFIAQIKHIPILSNDDACQIIHKLMNLVIFS